MLAASDIRRRWRSVVALTLLVGAVGAIVLATAAGARRSETALPGSTRTADRRTSRYPIGIPTAGQLATFRRSPGVAAFAYLDASSLVIKGYENLAIAAPEDSAMGNVVDRARLIKGRFADPSAPDEVTIGERLAARDAPRGGKPSRRRVVTQAQIDDAIRRRRFGAPAGPNVRLTVVGIVRRPLDLGVPRYRVALRC